MVTDSVDFLGGSIVTSTIRTGGTPSQEHYGGETTCSFEILSINMTSFSITVNLSVLIKYSESLLSSSSFALGTYAEYTLHDGASGGILDPCVREAVEAHETGHAEYAVNVICPALKSLLDLMEIRWRIQGWSEDKVRSEVVTLCHEVIVNHITRFNNAANAPTISWFNSSPEWRLVSAGGQTGTWVWAKAE